MGIAMTKINEEFTLTYKLDEHGWSELYFLEDVDKIPVGLIISHTFAEPLHQLSDIACQLINKQNEVSTVFYSEPGGYLVQFIRHDERHDLYQLTIGDIDSEYGDDIKIGNFLYKSIVRSDFIIVQIAGELTKIRNLLTFKWFNENRRDYFPETEYQTIIEYLNTRKDK